jgi:hypothetical protein
MVLEFINNNGAKYIRIVENKYVSKNGKPSCKNNVLLNVAPYLDLMMANLIM